MTERLQQVDASREELLQLRQNLVAMMAQTKEGNDGASTTPAEPNALKRPGQILNSPCACIAESNARNFYIALNGRI